MKILSRLKTVATSGWVGDVIKILYEASNGFFGELPVSFQLDCPFNGLSISKPDFKNIVSVQGDLWLSRKPDRFKDNSGKYIIESILLKDKKTVIVTFEDIDASSSSFVIKNAYISCGNDNFDITAKSGTLFSEGKLITDKLKCDLHIQFPSHAVKKLNL